MTFGPLYEAECDRWRARLDWNLRPSCDIIEEARRAGRLGGHLVRRDDGTLAGWSFFVLHDERLQIGGLVADTRASGLALIDAALGSAEGRRARGVSCYLFPEFPWVREILETSRFHVEPHRYMTTGLTSSAAAEVPSWPAGLTLRAFADAPGDAIVALLGRAYADMPDARCYAPDGRPSQWAHYVLQLLQTGACGRYLPTASAALVEASGELAGAILMTAIGDRTAHLAQIVVDPRWRGRALARDLYSWSRAVVQQAGYARMTLLVAEGNHAARRLYQRLGFCDTAVFLHGWRAVNEDNPGSDLLGTE